MKKVLKEDSPFHYLPKELGKNLLVYDALRVTLEMIDHCHEQLVKSLEIISKDYTNKIAYQSFNYAWSIIDHSQRFYNVYQKLNPPEHSIINKIKHVYTFRCAMQHVDKNIHETILPNKRPIYGYIKWVYSDVTSDTVSTNILISGIYNQSGFKFRVHKQSGYTEIINNIILETDTKGKKRENEINISELINDLSDIVEANEKKIIEACLEHNFNLVNWYKRKDIILKFKN